MSTLTNTEILQDVIAAFKVQVPFLFKIAKEFTSEQLKLGQTAIAHISQIPTVSTYDAAKGYGHADNIQESSGLVEDVSIIIDKHQHVDINITYLNSISDKKEVYQEAIENAAYALAKAVVDDVLAKALAANFSQETVIDAINYDRDTLGGVRKAMNKKGANPRNRIGIVNSDAFEALDSDPRIASSDYYGQQTGGSSLGVLRSVAGFGEVFEYPDLPANGESLNGFFFDPRAVCIKTGIPNDITKVAADLGVPSIANFSVETDPESGLSFLSIDHMKPGTFDIVSTVTLMWGVAAGKQAGTAGDKTDYAGHRVVEAP